MKRIISWVVVFVMLLLGFTPVYAQQSSSGNPSQELDTGFNLWWLLALLALPVLYFLFKGDNEDDRSHYMDQPFAGSKGGQSKKESDEEEKADE